MKATCIDSQVVDGLLVLRYQGHYTGYMIWDPFTPFLDLIPLPTTNITAAIKFTLIHDMNIRSLSRIGYSTSAESPQIH